MAETSINRSYTRGNVTIEMPNIVDLRKRYGNDEAARKDARRVANKKSYIKNQEKRRERARKYQDDKKTTLMKKKGYIEPKRGRPKKECEEEPVEN